MNLEEKFSNQLENYLNQDLPKQLQSIINLSQSKENSSVEWETDESPDYKFQIACIEGIIENIHLYDYSKTEKKELLSKLVILRDDLQVKLT